MIIKGMAWGDVPEGSIVLCADGIQREIGPNAKALDHQIRRTLGDTRVTQMPHVRVLVVDYDDECPDFNEAVITFLRAGMTVEVLPA